MNNRTTDSWQKRRLVIVAVGTICLLTLFIAFLMFRPQLHNAATSENEPVHVDHQNNLPLLPVGVESTRTGEQPEDHQDDTSKSLEEGQNGTFLLPLAEETKVGEEEDGVLADSSTNQGNHIADDLADSTQVEPASNADRQGATVRVPVSPTDQSDNDPFGDLFDNIDISSVIITDREIDRKTGGDEDGDLSTTLDRQFVEADGFAGFIEEDTLPTDPNGQKTTSDAKLPDDSERSELKEKEDGAGHEVIGLKEFDINERLTRPVTSIRFDRTPIVDVARVLADLSGVPMQLDIDELRARNISIEAPVSLQLRETTIAGIIDAILQKTRLTRHDGNGWLAFGYTGEQVNILRIARYDMSRLASLDQNPISAKQATDWLSVLLVNQFQNPKVFDATITVNGNEIVVVGTIWLQDQAKGLLQSLFYLRGLEPDNGMSPERLAPEVFGWDRVNAPLSFNLLEPIPLKEAARRIEQHTKLRILIDHAALLEEGLSQASQVTSRVSDGTIDTVLRGMLVPLGLTYRIVEANAVEITTPHAARQKMTIELHQYAPLAEGQTPESCAGILRQAFGGDANWNSETGGDIGGVIVIDPVSGYMLVRQSQPLQRDIRLWFGYKQAEENTEVKGDTEGGVVTP